MIRNLRTNKLLWSLNAVLSLSAALIGVFLPGVYSRVVDSRVIPGTISQDILTVLAAIALLALALSAGDEDVKRPIIILGILGYLFYAYGIYAIEQVYNFLYFVYLAIFSLSFYTMIYSVVSIRPQVLQAAVLPDSIRKISIGFSLFIAIFFSFLWIVRLVPLIQTGDRIEYLFSIFILDLSFIMPAFAILAILSAREQGLGLILTPALYVLGFTLLFPVGLGEMMKPLYGLPVDPSGAVLYFGIAALFLIITVVYLINLKFDRQRAG